MDPKVPEQRVAEAVPLLPEGGFLTGWASLLLRGAAHLDSRGPDGRTPRPVPLVVVPGNGRRPRVGATFLQDRLEAAATVHGMPCAPVRRSLFDEMRLQGDLREAVVAMDMAAAAQLVSVDRLLDARRRACFKASSHRVWTERAAQGLRTGHSGKGTQDRALRTGHSGQGTPA